MSPPVPGAALADLVLLRLILFNGPPATGKSTLAQRFANEHPPTLRGGTT